MLANEIEIAEDGGLHCVLRKLEGFPSVSREKTAERFPRKGSCGLQASDRGLDVIREEEIIVIPTDPRIPLGMVESGGSNLPEAREGSPVRVDRLIHHSDPFAVKFRVERDRSRSRVEDEEGFFLVILRKELSEGSSDCFKPAESAEMAINLHHGGVVEEVEEVEEVEVEVVDEVGARVVVEVVVVAAQAPEVTVPPPVHDPTGLDPLGPVCVVPPSEVPTTQ